VYTRAIEAGVAMFCVGTDERSSREAVEFAESHDDTWAIVGVHPHEAKGGWADIERVLRENCGSRVARGEASIIGIGEIGLDYFYTHSSREQQIHALEAQLQLATDYDLPVSFHVREAFDDFWPVFENFHGVRGVLHSFTDTQANLDRGFSRGLYVGVNGISTFTRDTAQRNLYATIPLERMLVETDAPYLTPVPLRGKMNEPGYVRLVVEFWAQKRGISFDELAHATTQNAHRLFGV
jgi:TatD DNase family protein